MKNVYKILAFNAQILVGGFFLVLVFASLRNNSILFASIFAALALLTFGWGIFMFKRHNMKTYFTQIRDMHLVRSAAQAIAFYDVYLLVIIVFAGVLGFFSAFFAQSYQEASRNAVVISVIAVWIASAWIGIKILLAKGRAKSILDILCIVISLALAIRGGVIAGLIPIAYLTTRTSLKKPTNKTNNIEQPQS